MTSGQDLETLLFEMRIESEDLAQTCLAHALETGAVDQAQAASPGG